LSQTCETKWEKAFANNNNNNPIGRRIWNKNFPPIELPPNPIGPNGLMVLNNPGKNAKPL